MFSGRPEKCDHTEWFNSVYQDLTGAGLWLRGGEINTLPPGEYASRPFRVLFSRLSTYEDSASSFTHSFLYEIASGIDGCFPDIAYLPPRKDLRHFAEGNVPWLIGTQTKYGPGAFDLVGFSNSILQEMLNIPPFLKNSGIPLLKSERMRRDDVPVILLGGANALHSTALWAPDPMVDGIFIGEDPAVIKVLLEAFAECKRQGKGKRDTLAALTDVPGFLLPDDLRGTVKCNLGRSAAPRIQEKGIVPFDTEQLGSAQLQVSEGCRAFCSFCSESWIRKPYRELSAELLLAKARRIKAVMGLEKISIFSFNFNMYSGLYDLLRGLAPMFGGVGLKSQRFDVLSSSPLMIDWEYAFGKTSLSCGLEGISARLRRYLNKGLDEASLKNSLSLVIGSNARELKVFLLATGREEEADHEEFERLLDQIRRFVVRHRSGTRIIFSVTPLVRFPWTPLEFDRASGASDVQKIMDRIGKSVKTAGFEFREAMGAREYAVSQVLARSSDDRMSGAIARSYERTGFVYYREVPERYLSAFMKELDACDGMAAQAFSGASLEESRRRKWSLVDTGIRRSALWRVYEMNSAFSETGPSPYPGTGGRSTHELDRLVERMKESKRTETSRVIRVALGRMALGVPRKYAGLALAGALMRADDALTPHFRRYGSSRIAPGGDLPSWVEGDDLFELVWTDKGAELLSRRLKDPLFVSAVNRELSGWGTVLARPSGGVPVFAFEFVSSFPFRGDGYLKNKGLKYTLYKGEAGRAKYVLTKEALKKGILSELSGALNADGQVSVEVMAGDKFDPVEFMKSAFVLPSKNSWMRIKATASILPVSTPAKDSV